MDRYKNYREFMKSNFNIAGDSDQEKELPQPPLQKPYDENAQVIDLPKVDESVLQNNSLYKFVSERRSRRKYSEQPISLEELAFILWATQGVKEIKGNNYATIRPVPSGGARHPFETYIVVNNVDGISKGVYRYLSLTHQLLFLFDEENLPKRVVEVTLGQKFAGTASITIIWSCTPYRGEWRYDISAHKTMLLDAGHLCQNLYLACEAVGCGTCAIAAYDQEEVDKFLGIDGEDEFVVYMAPVGKVQG